MPYRLVGNERLVRKKGGEIFVVFGIGRDCQRGRFWDIPEGVATQDVAIGFRADNVVPVVSASNGDLIEKGRIVDLRVVDAVAHVKDVV